MKRSVLKITKYLGVLITAGLLSACGANSISNEDIEAANSIETSVNNSEENNESSLKSTSNENGLEEMNVHYIDAGQADATLFEFKEGEEEYTILYDTGDWNNTDVVDYLSTNGIKELDLVIVSHPDADHIGQLDKIIQQFEVSEVWMSGDTSTSDVFARALAAIQKHEVGYYEPRAGDQFDIGPLDMEILHPSELTGDTNADSISMLISYGEIDFVFTGDAGKAQEIEIVNSEINVDAEILSLGHHGSNTSSDPVFIDAVSPEVAIYSAGAGNSYGHPHAGIVSLIQDKGIDLYGTDVNGTIIVTTDGREYVVRLTKDGDAITENQSSSESIENTASTQTTAKEENHSAKLPGSIDINTASYEELLEIVHIGPERAEEIMALRPFETVEALSQVNGIGSARLEDILVEGKAYVGGE
ncbi:MBL fold metallo-hydrolase [Desemzia sp. RIT804]|uniref:MBL fold metallo-hydrolase n=1 Tax=Desemzia sp. RIT 804 TaxID=2810209 RepID=UPI00195171EE|nr:MBL fold metallo-hydrolase [Desemzia sp. RIT 804]MBM6615573.1 MBL fold metallo-hydrolase [Desemzia sp. RIT 804]